MYISTGKEKLREVKQNTGPEPQERFPRLLWQKTHASRQVYIHIHIVLFTLNQLFRVERVARPKQCLVLPALFASVKLLAEVFVDKMLLFLYIYMYMSICDWCTFTAFRSWPGSFLPHNQPRAHVPGHSLRPGYQTAICAPDSSVFLRLHIIRAKTFVDMTLKLWRWCIYKHRHLLLRSILFAPGPKSLNIFKASMIIGIGVASQTKMNCHQVSHGTVLLCLLEYNVKQKHEVWQCQPALTFFANLCLIIKAESVLFFFFPLGSLTL